MYGSEMNGKAFRDKYLGLARWVLDHQDLFKFDELLDVADLADEIDVAIDNWIAKQDPRR